MQRNLIARMERQFLAYDMSVWQDTANAQALEQPHRELRLRPLFENDRR